MTLCIAAHANELGPSRIVLCWDSLIGDDRGTEESTIKCDPEFAPGLSVMFSGDLDDCDDAIRLYKQRLMATPPSLTHLKEQMWVGMKEFKAAAGRYGKKKTAVQLAVAGFVEGKPKILYVGSDGVQSAPSFLAIGTGAESANGMLRWRKLTPHRPLHDAMYFVYEAKRFGETSPWVGAHTSMFVIEPTLKKPYSGLRVRTVLSPGMSFLEAQFDRFGPQAYPPPLSKDLLPFPGDGLSP